MQTRESPAPTERAIARVMRAIASPTKLDEVRRHVVRAARELTGADGAAFVVRAGAEMAYLEEDAIAPLWKGLRFPVSRCISGWAVEQRDTVAIQDIYDDPRIPIEAYAQTFVKSLLTVPIRPEAPLGALSLYWATSHRPTEREEQVMKLLADAAAAAMVCAEARDLATAAQTAAAEATGAIEYYLAVISHELRTPLNAMLAWTHIAKARIDDDDTVRQAVDAIRRNAELQARIVDGLLDLAASGELELRMEDVNLCELVQRLVEEQRSTAVEKRIDLRGTYCERAIVRGDPTRLQQIAANLLSNAVKYTADGGSVHVVVEQQAADVTLAVEDSGIGMTPETLVVAFDAFRRAPSTAERATRGWGLGLAITKKLVDLHGGSISARSEIGKGSRFEVRLPAAG